MKMRAIAFAAHGGIDVLEDVELEIPDAPPAGQVRIRVAAVALNHLDLWVRRGLPGLKVTFPHRLGADVAGTIEAIGDGVKVPLTIGARVILNPGVSCGACEACLSGHDNLCRHYGILGEHVDGGYGEFLDVFAQNVVPLPASLAISFEEAAALPLVSLTAWQMVVTKGKVKRGDVVLVHAAGAGVSTAAIQIAKAHGAWVIVTSTNAEKLPRARALGADHAIDSRAVDFVAEVKKLTGKRGVDLVVEHVGGEVFEKSILAMTAGGRLVTCGATAGFTPAIDLRHVFFRQLEILGSTMGSKAELFAALRLVESGALRPVVDRVLPFGAEGARAAHRALEAREVFGKVVLSFAAK